MGRWCPFTVKEVKDTPEKEKAEGGSFLERPENEQEGR